jgi:hypothetical protein
VIEAREPGPEVPPPHNRVRRVVVIVSAFAVFFVAGAFAWSAFRPSSEPATVGSSDSTALVASLVAPADGTIPGLTLAYGNEDRQYFAEGGHWPGVNGFNQPGFGFATPLPPGTTLKIGGDASQVSGKLEVLEKNYQSTGQELPLDLSGGSVTLPNDPGFYRLDLTGTWPQGTAEFFVVIQIRPANVPCNEPTRDASSRLVGHNTATYPDRVLDKPGKPAGSLFRYGSDVLRRFLASPPATGAPTDGWRTIQNNLRTVTFAAPSPGSESGWWVVSFETVVRTPVPTQQCASGSSSP